MARDYMKVTRGMVFRYNINPEVDKFNVPKIEIKGKEYINHLQYGWRTYLVVSNDIANAESPVCSIVPMTAKVDKADIPTHVKLNYQGNELTILCEHIYPVNKVELTQFECLLSNDIMEKVDDALAVQLGLKKIKHVDPNISLSLDMIEDIIQGIITEKVNQLQPVRANAVDIEDAVLRLGSGLESLFSSKILEGKKERTVESGKTDDTSVTTGRIPSKKYPNLNLSEELQLSEQGAKSLSKHREEMKAKNQTATEKFYAKFPNLNPENMNTLPKQSTITDIEDAVSVNYGNMVSDTSERLTYHPDLSGLNITPSDIDSDTEDDKPLDTTGIRGYDNSKDSTEKQSAKVESRENKENKETKKSKTKKQSAKTKAKPKSKAKTGQKTERRVWTMELLQNFVGDMEILTPTEMVEKYNMKSVNDYYKHRYYAKNRLQQLLEKQENSK